MERNDLTGVLQITCEQEHVDVDEKEEGEVKKKAQQKLIKSKMESNLYLLCDKWLNVFALRSMQPHQR